MGEEEQAAVPEQKAERRTSVAIVGFADSWPLAPYHNLKWDIWTLNQFYDLVGAGPDLTGGRINFRDLAAEGRLTWFDIHRRHDLENDPNVIARHPEHLKRLAALGAMGVPVWMHQEWEDIPNSRAYPLAEMTERFGGYWTNSVSYMLALAISMNYTTIGLYGVNMAQDSEYQAQRPSCEYFIGWARALGITVHIPPQSDLLKAAYLYGYEDDRVSATIAKLDQLRAEHQQKMAMHAQARDENDAYYQQFSGAVQQIDAFKRIIGIVR